MIMIIIIIIITSKYSFLFNIGNYSPEVINNFDIKLKKTSNIFFIICHQQQTKYGKITTNKTQVFYHEN